MMAKENSQDLENYCFLIEGKLSEIHVELGSENLLKKVDAHYKKTSAITATGAVIGDMFGQASSAAMLAMYDGEDTQNFIALLDQQVVCGQFAGAQFLKNGNQVKMVVSRQGEVLVAHAILDPVQGYIWVTHPWGSKAEKRANWKLALEGYLIGNLCLALVLFFQGGRESLFENMLYPAIGFGVIMLLVAVSSNRAMRTLADPSTEIFRMLGFAEPEKVDLNNFGLTSVLSREHLRDRTPRPAELDLSEYQYRNVFCYQTAIEAGKLSMAETGKS